MKPFLAVLLLLGGSLSPAAEPLLAPAPASFPGISGDYSPAKAMTALYGSFDPATQSSVWPTRKLGAAPSTAPDPVRVQILLDRGYSENGQTKHLLLTWLGHLSAKSDEGMADCHACGVQLGLAVFAQQPSGWKVEFAHLRFGQLGAWGAPPPAPALIELSPDSHALFFHQGDTHQGIVSSFFSGYLLVPGAIRPIFSAGHEGEETLWNHRCEAFLASSAPKVDKRTIESICEFSDSSIRALASENAGETAPAGFPDLALVRTYPAQPPCLDAPTGPRVEVLDRYRYNAQLRRYRYLSRAAAPAPPAKPASGCESHSRSSDEAAARMKLLF